MRAYSLATLFLLGLTTTASAFMTAPALSSSSSTRPATSAIAAVNNNNNNNEQDADAAALPTSSRRGLLRSLGIAAAAAVVSSTTITPTLPASATYSAYTHREQDWQERLDKGEVKVSSARDLRRQLREIAPMNDEGSKIFCPNGPSSAVSPMMENKCDDVRQAIPSVYGRTEDTVGNSIPGFAGGRYTAGGGGMGGGISGNIAADIGGFPTYDPKTGRSER